MNSDAWTIKGVEKANGKRHFSLSDEGFVRQAADYFSLKSSSCARPLCVRTSRQLLEENYSP